MLLGFYLPLSLAFLLSGGAIHSAEPDTLHRLWSRHSHRGEVNSVTFSPNGALGASAADNGSANLFRISDGLNLGQFGVPATLPAVPGSSGEDMRGIAFSPDGTRLLVGGESDWRGGILSAAIYSTNGAIIRLLGDLSNIRDVDWSPDNTHVIVVGGPQIPLRRLETNSTGIITTLVAMLGSPANAPFRTAAFSPDGRSIAAGDDAGILHLFTGTNLTTSIEAHEGFVRALAFSPNGHWIATGGDDGDVHLWSSTNLAHVRTFSGHSDWVRSVAFTSDSARLCSAGWDNVLNIWNTQNAELMHTITEPAPIRSIDISPGDDLLLLGNKDGQVKLLNFPALTLRQEITAHPAPIMDQAFSADGNALVSSDSAGNLLFSDAKTGRVINRVIQAHLPDQLASGTIKILARSGTTEIYSAGDDRLRVWDSTSGRPLRTLRDPEGVSRAIISQDGSIAATINNSKLRLWDLQTASVLRDMPMGPGRPLDFYPQEFAFRGASNIVFASLREQVGEPITNQITVVSVTSGLVLTNYIIPALPVFTADGHHFYWYSANGILFRETWSNRPVQTRLPSSIFLSSQVPSLNRGTVVSLQDGELRLWHVSTGVLLGRATVWPLLFHSFVPFAVSPDGSGIALLGDHNSILVSGFTAMVLRIATSGTGAFSLISLNPQNVSIHLERSINLRDWSPLLAPHTNETTLQVSGPLEFFRLRSPAP